MPSTNYKAKIRMCPSTMVIKTTYKHALTRLCVIECGLSNIEHLEWIKRKVLYLNAVVAERVS